MQKEGVDVNLISNFKSANTKLVLGNYYKGSDVKRILLLIRDFILLLFYCIQRKKQIFIYQSFGFRIIDIIFLFYYLSYAVKRICWFMIFMN